MKDALAALLFGWRGGFVVFALMAAGFVLAARLLAWVEKWRNRRR